MNEEMKASVIALVESRVSACRSAISAALDQVTEEIKAGVAGVVTTASKVPLRVVPAPTGTRTTLSFNAIF